VGGTQNGEDFITRDRMVTGKRKVLMSREEQEVSFITQNVFTAGEMLMGGSLQLGSSFIRGHTLVEIVDSFL